MRPAYLLILCLGLTVLNPASLRAQEDSGSPREQAQAAYEAGNFAEAQSLLETLLLQTPDDPDLLRRLAALQAARQQLDAAQASIDRAAALAPHDADIRLARAYILLWRGDLVRSQQEEESLARSHPGYPGLSELQLALENRRRGQGFRLVSATLTQSVSTVRFPSGYHQRWWSQNASLTARAGKNVYASADAQREMRATTDTRISARAAWAGDRQEYFLRASFTPHPEFRESWSVRAGADFGMSARTALLLDTRYARYRLTDASVLGVGLQQDLGSNFRLTGRTIHMFGAGRGYGLGASLRADYAAAGGATYFASFASYPETEANETRQLSAVAAGAAIPIGRGLTLRLTSEYESRASSYKRLSALAGITVRIGE